MFYVKIISFQRHNQHGAARGRRKPFHIDDFLSQSVSTLRLYVKTRLTYNCAHLRSTKESLTIEYFEKKLIFWVKIFCVRNCLGEIFLDEIFLGEIFFGLKIFLMQNFFG